MSQMAEALAKVGLITEKTAQRVDRDMQKGTVEKKKEEKSKKQYRSQDIKTNPELAQFDELWNNAKSKKFLKHLIYSFTPSNKVDKIWCDEDKYEKKCCICLVGILSINQIMKIVKQDNGESLVAHAKFIISNEGKMPDEEYKKKHEEFMKNMGHEMFRGKLLGYIGQNSKKVMCPVCYEKFYAWVMERLMRGDREISKIVRQMRLKTI